MSQTTGQPITGRNSQYIDPNEEIQPIPNPGGLVTLSRELCKKLDDERKKRNRNRQNRREKGDIVSEDEGDLFEEDTELVEVDRHLRDDKIEEALRHKSTTLPLEETRTPAPEDRDVLIRDEEAAQTSGPLTIINFHPVTGILSNVKGHLNYPWSTNHQASIQSNGKPTIAPNILRKLTMGNDSASLYDILPVSVRSFLGSNPPVHIWDGDGYERSELTAPLIFHERHLDALLMLRNVKVIPLERFLPLALELTLKSVVDRDGELPTIGQLGVFDEHKDQKLHKISVLSLNANRVAQKYKKNTSLYSCYLASTLLFYPRASRWSGVCLDWRAMDISEHRLAAALDCYGLNVQSSECLTQNEKEVIDSDTHELIETLYRQRRPLAWWQIFFFDEEAKSLLTDMDRIASIRSFDAGRCNTYGYRLPPSSTFAPSVDASITPWGTPVSSLCVESTDPGPHIFQEEVHTTRASLRNRDKRPGYAQSERNQPESSSKRPRNLSLWPQVKLPGRPAHSMMDLFLLRAWAQAVEHDTTFIVFHCGNYERIGFRHRESQTLFISSLIDIHNCSDPYYGELQAGLYVSIVQDAINRIKRQHELENTKPKSRKRRKGPDEEEPPRQYKTRSMVSKERAEAEERDRDYEAVKLHAPKRSLALVELRFGQYNSSAPAAFIRSGTKKKKTYKSDEYLSLVLTSKLEYGAIGVVYDARLEVLADGCTRKARVVVKIGSKEKEIKSMRYEHSIYQQLSSHNVMEGIPYIFGLYEDVEANTVALVMSYAGNCLWQLRPDKTKGYVRVPKAVEEAYIRILNNIHKAGICHGDIGEQNLMLSDDGRATIIDFDRAEKHPNQDQKDAEVQELMALFRVKSPAPRPELAEKIATQRDLLDDLLAELESEDGMNSQNEDIERNSSNDFIPKSPIQVDSSRNAEGDDCVNAHS
ncbi:hypothetical protein C0992_000294 [Termitomyces sp. T32_za158]|nr:hypothetical protein C0992_000294 [Termitomyces sp. T32_za158]